MKIWLAALNRVAAGWRWWAATAMVLAGAAAAGVLWLRAPLATWTDLAIEACYTVMAPAALVWALVILKRHFAAGGVRLARVMQRVEFWGAAALFAAAAFWAPWRLIHWVPRLESLPGQMVSAGARLLLAWALFTGSLCWMTACLGLLSGESEDGKTVPAGERKDAAIG